MVFYRCMPDYTHSPDTRQSRKLSGYAERHTPTTSSRMTSKQSRPQRDLSISILILACAGLCSRTIARAQQNPDASAADLAKQAAENELQILEYKAPLLRYRMHTIDSKGNQIRDVIESKDGTVARLIYKEGRELTKEEDAAERTRLQAMLDNPDAFQKHVRNDNASKKQASDVIHQMPPAMLWTYTPGQPQRSAESAHEIVLDFAPDPHWSPSGLAANALTGLKGRVWIDPKSHVMVHLEASVFQSVNVGFGLFAHVYPGGSLSFDQVQAEPSRWIFSQFKERLTVRALLLKTFKENNDIESSNYATVPAMSYQEAVHLLLDTPLATSN